VRRRIYPGLLISLLIELTYGSLSADKRASWAILGGVGGLSLNTAKGERKKELDRESRLNLIKAEFHFEKSPKLNSQRINGKTRGILNPFHVLSLLYKLDYQTPSRVLYHSCKVLQISNALSYTLVNSFETILSQQTFALLQFC